MTTEERLERVEREQAETRAELARAKRRVRRVMVAGAVALASIVVLVAAWACVPEASAQAAAQVVAEVRARRFLVVDERGKPRAALTVSRDVPGLTMLDENGRIIWFAPPGRMR